MIELKLTVEEVNLILKGLQELPAKFSLDLIIKIKNEGDIQFEAKNPKPTEIKD